MSEPMRVDKQRTRQARAAHNAGVQLLRRALVRGSGGSLMAYLGQQKAQRDAQAAPWRRRKGCPPVRTPLQKARHLRRKRARASKKRNR